MNKEEQYLNAMIDVAYNALQKECDKIDTYWCDCLNLYEFVKGNNVFLHNEVVTERIFDYDGYCPLNTSKREVGFYFESLRTKWSKFMKNKLVADAFAYQIQNSNKVAKVYKDLADSAKRATKEGNL